MKLPLKSAKTSLLRAFFFFSFLASLLIGLTSLDAYAQLQGGFNPDLDYQLGAQPWPKAVHAFVVQPNGKLIVAADSKLIRLNSDGSKDAVIGDLATAFNARGSAMETQSDGKILVGLSYVSSSTSRLIRLNADGSVDSGFNTPRDPTSGANGSVVAIAIAPNGDIYIADRFEGGNVRIFKLRPDGSLYNIPDFYPVSVVGETLSSLAVEDLLVDASGKLVVAGSVSATNLPTTRDVFRVNGDGGLDTSFTPPDFNNGWVGAVAQKSDGKFMVVGQFSVSDGTNIRQGLIRLNADGTLDGAYNSGPGGGGAEMALQADGTTIIGRQGNGGLARFAANGVQDSSFSSTVNGYSSGNVLGIVVLADGTIYANGTSLSRGSTVLNIIRFRPDGVPDVPISRFDYDGDNLADLTVFRPSNRVWYTKTTQNFTSGEFGIATDEAVPADYDGDAKTDIAVWRPENGTWYWINSSSNTFSVLQWGQNGDVPVAGNAAWDKRAPFTVYRPSTGTWYRLEGSTYRINVLQFGSPGDVPLGGRYVNRAPFQSTPTLYRPSTGQFILGAWEVPAPAPTIVQWGQVGDIPVSGDFDGDYVTDLAVYRPSDSKWEIRRSGVVGTGSQWTVYTKNWGEAGDIPVVADYDSDGRDDIAVFRPSNGQWYVLNSTILNQTPTSFSVREFGVQGDRPAQAAYLP